MRLTFTNTWLLYLLWLVPLWFLLLHSLRKKQEQKRKQFTGPVLARKLLPAENQRFIWLQEIVLASAVFLLLFAAAGPRNARPQEQEVAMRGRDIVLLLDVSRSMLADDVRPSRLGRAKADMLDILDELRPGDRIAIVTFRYRATRISPFTSDRGFLRQTIAGLSIDSAPAGETNIGAGIRMALEIFDDDTPSHKAVVLLSDGEDLTGDALEAARAAAKQDIPFFTVGIGSRSGSTIPDRESPTGLFQFEGEPVITRLEEESLVNLARLTGGAYIPVETAGAGAISLGQRMRDHLRAIEVRTYATLETSDYTEIFHYFLLPAIILLLIGGSLSQGPLRQHARITHAALILLLGASAAMANTNHDTPNQSHRVLAREAQQLQQQDQFAEAVQMYLEAAKLPDIPSRLRDRYRYNAAIASLQAGDPETASTLLERLPPIRQANLARALAAFEQGLQATDGSAEGYRERFTQWQEAATLLQHQWQQTGEPQSEEDLQKLDALLAQASQEVRLADILERYAEKEPSQLAWDMLQQQRKQDETLQREDLPPVGPDRLRYFQDRARERNELAEQYLALSHLLRSDGIPPEQYNQLLEEQQALEQQIALLEDLSRPTDKHEAEIGHPLYHAWRERGAPETFLSESLRQQEWLDALARDPDTTRPPPVPLSRLQSEAATLTDRFAERFQLPPETDPELAQEIEALTDDASRLQRLASEMLELDDVASARPVQEEALEALRRLSELLPQETDPETDEPDDDTPDPETPDTPPDGEPDEDEPDLELPPPPTPEDPDDEEEMEDTPEDIEPEDEEEDTFDLDAMLEQVEQRSQEYQELLDERRRRLQRQETTRDW